MKGRHWLVLRALVLIGLLLSACAPAAAPAPTLAPAAPTPAPAPTPKPAAAPLEEKPRYGGTLKIGINQDPPGFDPQVHAITAVNYSVLGLFNGLFWYDPASHLEPKPVPDLAERWELSPDGTVYTFYLNKGVKFHDGGPLTARDIVFSLNKILAPPQGILPSRMAAGLIAVEKLEALDDHMVKITLKHPSAEFIMNLSEAQIAVVPKDYMEKGGYKEGKNALDKKPIGSGPFMFKEVVRGVSFEAVKNPNYFKKGFPYLEGYIAYIILDDGARMAALRTERIHTIPHTIAGRLSEETVLKRELGDKVLTWHNFPASGFNLVGLNHKRKPFDDLRVRKAIRMALNNEEFTKIVWEGLASVSGPVRGYWALPQEELQKYPGFEPNYEARLAKARELLAEAGYPKGFDMESSGVGARWYDMGNMQYVAAALKRIGINVKVVPQEGGAFYSNLEKGTYDSFVGWLGAFSGQPDGVFGSFYITGGVRNYVRYSNPKFDELYAKQTRELDPAKRREIVWEMQRIILQDIAWPMYGGPGTVANQLAVVRGGRVAAPFTSYFNLRNETFWLAK